ncbi:hypothetical protein ABBQ32_000367 [Trebouxia sp. C0010 RCD-2024]
MLSTCKSAQPLARLANQLITFRGQKASTAKLPVMLLKDIDSLGEQGQQVEVSHGFARNYLYPRGQAAPVPTKPRARHTKLSQPSQVMKCSANAAGELVESIGAEHIVAAVQQQLRIELAPQLINLSQPFTALGERKAVLHMTLPDGSKPAIQVHLTGNQ